MIRDKNKQERGESRRKICICMFIHIYIFAYYLLIDGWDVEPFLWNQGQC